MKKIIYILSILSVAFFSSCDNKAIPESIIDPPVNEKLYDVNVTVSLSDFFQCYDFHDNKHSIKQISEVYRTFNSDYNRTIQVRTLIYNSNGDLVDSILENSTNTNQVIKVRKLKSGNYTAVSTLVFTDNQLNSEWHLVNKESLSTAQLQCYNNESKWSILSYGAKEFTVTNGSVNVYITPSPVGALTYIFYENFWTEPGADNDSIAIDNGIRSIGLYTNQYAWGFMLNPELPDQYVYFDDAGGSSVWRLSAQIKPSDFDWDFFETNICDYVYILAPKCNIIFGYEIDDDNNLDGGTILDVYSIEAGKTYLAYWDYLYEGNPYFGLADNQHWDRTKSLMKKSSIFNVKKNSDFMHPKESNDYRSIR